MILENKWALLDPSSIQDCLPWDSSKQDPKQAKICSLEVQGCGPAVLSDLFVPLRILRGSQPAKLYLICVAAWPQYFSWGWSSYGSKSCKGTANHLKSHLPKNDLKQDSMIHHSDCIHPVMDHCHASDFHYLTSSSSSLLLTDSWNNSDPLLTFPCPSLPLLFLAFFPRLLNSVLYFSILLGRGQIIQSHPCSTEIHIQLHTSILSSHPPFFFFSSVITFWTALFIPFYPHDAFISTWCT